MDQLAWRLVVRIQAESLGIHFCPGDLEPLSGAFDVLLDLSHRSEVLVQLALVRLAQLAMQGLGLVHEKVEVTAGPGETFSLGIDGVSLQPEQTLENDGRPVEGGDWLTGSRIRKCVGPSRQSHSAVRGEHQAREAGTCSQLMGPSHVLVQGNGVLQPGRRQT